MKAPIPLDPHRRPHERLRREGVSLIPVAIIAAGLCLGFTACERDSDLDDAMEDAGDEIEEATDGADSIGEEVGDAAEDAAEDIEDAAEEAGDAVDD